MAINEMGLTPTAKETMLFHTDSAQLQRGDVVRVQIAAENRYRDAIIAVVNNVPFYVWLDTGEHVSAASVLGTSGNYCRPVPPGSRYSVGE